MDAETRYRETIGRMADADDYLAALEDAGWTDGMEPGQRRRLEVDVQAQWLQDPDRAFEALADVELPFEVVDGAGPERRSYHTLLLDLAAATDGAFDPTDIRDELDDELGEARVSFSARGERHNLILDYDGSPELDPNLVAYVNEALAQAHVIPRFIALPSDEDAIALVFVDPGLFSRAVAAGLIPGEG